MNFGGEVKGRLEVAHLLSQRHRLLQVGIHGLRLIGLPALHGSFQQTGQLFGEALLLRVGRYRYGGELFSTLPLHGVHADKC